MASYNAYGILADDVSRDRENALTMCDRYEGPQKEACIQATNQYYARRLKQQVPLGLMQKAQAEQPA